MHFHEDMDRTKADGAKWLHVDIMDGHFVPNMSFGYAWVKSMRKITDLVLDVHLMIDTPIKYAQEFCKAGADYLTVHVEADTTENIHKTIDLIRSLGVKPGIVVKPNTPAEAIAEFLPKVDLVLVMTVEPGFGGQGLREDCLKKLPVLKKMIEETGRDIILEVDGGIKQENAHMAIDAGAQMLVMGTGLFRAKDPKAVVKAVRKAAEGK